MTTTTEGRLITTARCSCPETHNPFPAGTAPANGSSDLCQNQPSFVCPSCLFAVCETCSSGHDDDPRCYLCSQEDSNA